MNLNRRSLLQLSTAAIAMGSMGLPARAAIEELVIAYNVNLPSWDPTVGPSAVNPTIQGIYQSVFDQFILQQPDLKPAPGLLTEWGWNDDRTKVVMKVREGVTWHDGSPFTAEDVAWSLTPRGGREDRQPHPVHLVDAGQHQGRGQHGDGRRHPLRAHDLQVDVFPHRLCAAQGLLREGGRGRLRGGSIGTGPYMVEKFERNAFVRLKANANYWGGKPEFETVTIKFVPDAAARVAEVESGNSHVTLEMPTRNSTVSRAGRSPACRRRSPTSA